MDRFTSRKFILAAASFAAVMLTAVGVIDQSNEQLLAESVTAAVYIIIQGLLDA